MKRKKEGTGKGEGKEINNKNFRVTHCDRKHTPIPDLVLSLCQWPPHEPFLVLLLCAIVKDAPQTSLSPLVTIRDLSSMNLSKPSNLFLDSAFATFHLYLKASLWVSSGWLVENEKTSPSKRELEQVPFKHYLCHSRNSLGPNICPPWIIWFI